MKFQLTQEHIDIADDIAASNYQSFIVPYAGIPLVESCPIAQCISQQIPGVQVSSASAAFYARSTGTWHYLHFPDKVIDAIINWDGGKGMEPMEFEL